MPTHSRQDILDIIDYTRRWQVTPHGIHFFRLGQPTVTLDDATLHLCHPLFPDVLRAAAARYMPMYGTDSIPAGVLLDQLHYLCEPTWRFQDTTGKTWDVLGIWELDQPAYEPHIVLSVNTAVVEVSNQEPSVTYIAETRAVQLHVNRQWLESTYPGWEVRLQVLEALGDMPYDEMMRSVFATPVLTTDVDLTGLSLTPSAGDNYIA